MTSWKSLGAVVLIAGALSAQQAADDPVMKIQSQRTSNGEGDLPPVPRGILEPPPLPAPETHVKDTRGWRASKATRKVHRRIVKNPRGNPVVSHRKKIVKKRP